MSFLEREDLRIHYETMGDGAPVCLIHGLGANMAFWYMGLARALSPSYQVILHDLRGHGRTDLPKAGFGIDDLVSDLTALLDHLGHEKAHIVGHSHGARVALAFAGQHTARTASLSVIDTQLRALQPPTKLRDWPHWKTWSEDLKEQGISDLPEDHEVIDFRLLTRLADYDRAPKRKRVSMRRRDMGVRGNKRWREMMNTDGVADAIANESPLSLSFLRKIDVPTLLLYGQLSHCVPSGERLAQVLPQARLSLVPGAGHFVPAAKPIMVNRAVRNFIDGSSERPETRGWLRNRRRANRLDAADGEIL